MDKWLRFRGKAPQIQKVIYWDDKGLTSMNDPMLMRFEDLMELGKANLAKNQAPTKPINKPTNKKIKGSHCSIFTICGTCWIFNDFVGKPPALL